MSSKTQPHETRKYKTVKHRHPKRTEMILAVDYGDMIEVTKITSVEKPVNKLEYKNEKNPEKIYIQDIGQLRIFVYKNNRDYFFVSSKDGVYSIKSDLALLLSRAHLKLVNFWRAFDKRVENLEEKK